MGSTPIDFTPFNGLKVLAHSEKIKEILDGRIPYPVCAQIDLSNHCNHDCAWCFYHDFRKRHEGYFPKERLFNLIDELVSCDVKAILFAGGGEPLMYPFFVEVLERCGEFGMDIGISTNGSLLSNDRIRKAIVDNARYVRVSLDAATRETHHKLHRTLEKKEFDSILTSVKELSRTRKKDRPEIGYAYLACEENYNEISVAVRKAIDYGFDYIQFRPVIGHKYSDDLVNRINEKISMELAISRTGNTFPIYGLLHRFEEMKTHDKGFDKCYSTPLVAVVGADLKCYMCCQWRGEACAEVCDLSKKTFLAAWGSKEHQKKLKSFDYSKCFPCRHKLYNQAIDKVFVKDKMHRNFL